MLFVDAHAHIYRCFDSPTALDGAVENFRRADRSRREGPLRGCLLLAETTNETWYEDHREVESLGGGRWRLTANEADGSILAHGPTGDELVIIAGRQIQTAESLEVLALGGRAPLSEGLSTEETVASARAAGAIVVLPWGVGKWWGHRGRVVREVLEARSGTEIFVGDNGNRLRFGPMPPLFSLAARRGIRNLPGSDPLPWPGEAARVGRYGFVVRGEISRTTPARDLKIMLESPLPIDRFGHLESLGRFLRAQSAMQWRKRTPRLRSR